MKPIETGVIDLGNSCFVSSDLRVISYQGENYYKACGHLVSEKGEKTTSCILPEGHAYRNHEDFYGNLCDGFVATSYTDEIRGIFRRTLLRSGLDDTQVFNALNAIQMAGLKLSINNEEMA